MKQGTGRSVRTAAARGKARAAVKTWTKTRETIFFEELAATANVSHAARAADISETSARNRKRNNPEFAAAWRRALDLGYAELEMHMLRQSINGSERTESVRDEDGKVRQTKTVHSYPHGIAMSLLAMHRDEVERYRAMESLRDGADPAVADRVRAELAKVRARLEADAGDDGRDGEGWQDEDVDA
ncbi:MAG: hypothetical protein ABW048_07275 [Sphingobium sp.]